MSRLFFESSGWHLIEDPFDAEHIAENETLFSLSNGSVGIRGAFEERRCVARPGVFINGFYDTEPIHYGERFPGYAQFRQQMIPAPDGTIIELYVGDSPFDLSIGELISYRRRLDMRCGVLHRAVTWRAPSGPVIRLHVWRVVPHQSDYQFAIRWVLFTDRTTPLTIISRLTGKTGPITAAATIDDPRGAFDTDAMSLRLRRRFLFKNGGGMRFSTRNSKLGITCSMHHTFFCSRHHSTTIEPGIGEVAQRFQLISMPDEPVSLLKYVSYRLHHNIDARVREARPAKLNLPVVGQDPKRHFADMVASQYGFLGQFWDSFDMEIEGDEEAQRIVRFSLLNLMQSVRKRGAGSVPAKGLSGNGYDGHYFWDAEIYVFPFLLYCLPALARNLLDFRYTTLPQARERALEMGLAGALYPWRTIDGREASPYYPAGTAQYHINADISYALHRYLQTTGDDQFLLSKGLEVAIEIARMWQSLGDWIDGKGFCINMVTGPDEYTVMTDNNCYTNVMARDALLKAVGIVELAQQRWPQEYQEIATRLKLLPQEVAEWLRAGESIYLPYDSARRLYAQDDYFFHRAPWKYGEKPNPDRPLLLQYHPLIIYRYQILKQPDLVMALFLQSRHFSHEEKKRNFEYYEAITTADSSLGASVRSIMAAEVGDHRLAWNHFQNTLKIDIENTNGNTRDGLHIAAAGGIWMNIVYGFGGFRDDGELPLFRPRIPDEWRRLRFSLRVRGTRLVVTIDHRQVSYRITEGASLTISHRGQPVQLVADQPITIPL